MMKECNIWSITRRGKSYYAAYWVDKPNDITDWYRKQMDAVIALNGENTTHIKQLGVLTDLKFKEEYTW